MTRRSGLPGSGNARFFANLDLQERLRNKPPMASPSKIEWTDHTWNPFAAELDRSIQIWTADFNERVDDVVRIVRARSPRAGRAIFLLDQYGWSQVAFRSIRAILEQLQKAEIFLTFSVDALIDYLSSRSHEMRAFGEIDVDPALVQELVRLKEEEQLGYRILIQNGLYSHIQSATGAPFYSPFFIKSPEAHRSYWFIHLSKHREARNEIGMIHWAENNTTVHHGGAGLHALGFSTGKNIDQMTMEYIFDEHAKDLSRAVLKQQLPNLIYKAADSDIAPSLEELFGIRCNDTPVVRELLEETLIALRAERELIIVDETGRAKPRANTIEWSDRIVSACGCCRHSDCTAPPKQKNSDLFSRRGRPVPMLLVIVRCRLVISD
jgi:three-Cys-motif partner protein